MYSSGMNIGLFEALKREMRKENRTYAQLAEHLDISEATIKRAFSKKTMTTERLCQTCDFLGISLKYLLGSAKFSRTKKLNPDQEYFLAEHVQHFLFLYYLLNSWSIPDAADQLSFPLDEARKIVKDLEAIKVLQRTKADDFQLLIDRDYQWSKEGPLENFFQTMLIPHFVQYKAQGSHFFLAGELSEASASKLAVHLRAVIEEFKTTASFDCKLPKANSKSYGLYLNLKPWTLSREDVPT